MMSTFSPVTRRIVALGILFLGLSGLINFVIIPIGSLMSDSVAELRDARFGLKRLKTIEARPSPKSGDQVPASFYINAPSRKIASDVLAGKINETAGRHQVQLANISLQPASSNEQPTLSLSFSASGEQNNLLSFVQELEGGAPLIRFSTWSLISQVPTPSPTPAPANSNQPVQLNFSGTATAVWVNQR